MRRVLMIAYHFPPLAGSSGIQRTLRFARYLSEFGWEPTVLTAHPRAYERRSDDQLVDVPAGIEVIRAPAWDASRHFAIAGRYPALLARPDRWISWWPGAVFAGMRAIKRMRPDAIWSTYPIATAHHIAAGLAHRSSLPWIADFRDPMAQKGYPPDPATHRSFTRIETQTMSGARIATFTTPGAGRIYRERYRDCASRIRLLENGYDDDTFADVTASSEPLNRGYLTLLHSGVVYPRSRDPQDLIAALATLKAEEPETYARVRLRFRAAMHDNMLADLGRRYDVAEALELLSPIGYREALEEMLRADGLLVLQASNCNQQVPAKLYEYFRARRPILALTDPLGDTASVAQAAGISAIRPLDDAAAIADLIKRFVAAPTEGTLAAETAIASASRRGRTEQLAALLNEVSA